MEVSSSSDVEDSIFAAAQAIKEAHVLLFHLGAGMSADSGLSVFVDLANVPAYKERNLSYIDLSQPVWLEKGDPETFYGFWGSCLANYRKAVPHQGYEILKKWAQQKEDFFLYTSNIDGYGLRSGMVPPDRLYEIHGNLETWQCSKPGQCGGRVRSWAIPNSYRFDIDIETMLASPKCDSYTFEPSENDTNLGEEISFCISAFSGRWPHCPQCGALARPCVLMFNDDDVNMWQRSAKQQQQWQHWLQVTFTKLMRKHRNNNNYDNNNIKVRQNDDNNNYYYDDDDDNINYCKVVVIEIGAGLNVPTLRFASARMLERVRTHHRQCPAATLVRINAREAHADDAGQKKNTISLYLGAKDALRRIDEKINKFK